MIKLNILASDIEVTDYINARDCAITRALKRAGYDYQHEGTDITDESGKSVYTYENSNVFKLGSKVWHMYSRDIPIKDFEFILKKNKE